MPLIILCGQPSSGKSTVASALERELTQSQKEVVVISEQTLHQDRNAAYSGTYKRVQLGYDECNSALTHQFCRLCQREEAPGQPKGYSR